MVMKKIQEKSDLINCEDYVDESKFSFVRNVWLLWAQSWFGVSLYSALRADKQPAQLQGTHGYLDGDKFVITI